jgi:NAD(P)-dependent dehydrogenase (short-subunit alcohol dehydrogenase family)
MAGAKAYTTSKQCNLATMLVLADENPRLRINALEPGFIPNTGLGRDANFFLQLITNYVLPLLAPHIKNWSTPQQAARVASKVLLNESDQTGVYYDEAGQPKLPSTQVRDQSFVQRVIDETRALLASMSEQSAICN